MKGGDTSKVDNSLDSSFFSIGGFKTKKGKGTIARIREGAEMDVLNMRVMHGGGLGEKDADSNFLFTDGV